jgi:hypothetical protein
MYGCLERREHELGVDISADRSANQLQLHATSIAARHANPGASATCVISATHAANLANTDIGTQPLLELVAVPAI